MKTIKKIVALVTGATMLGATIMGAMAAVPDLKDYPSFFVKDTTFDGEVGIGDLAAAQDVVGAIDVVGALSVVSVTESVPGETSAATVSEGVLVKAAGEDLNYGESFADVLVGSVDKEDMPTLLADGTYEDNEGDTTNEEDYEQKLTFTDGTDEIVFESNKNTDKADTFLKIDKDQPTYTYDLTFDNAIEFTATEADVDDDFANTYITMLNNEYKIVDAEATDDVLTTLKMIGGAVTTMLSQGEKATVQVGDASYEVECYYIGGETSKAAFKINGVDSGTLSETQTKKISGIRIGIDTIFEEEAGEATADMVKFYLGAEELIFENNVELKLNGETLDGAVVTLGNTVDNELDSINIEYTPDDKVWLAAGEEWEDPIFGGFKFIFAGLDKATETYTLTADTDDEATFKFMNNEGGEVELPMVQIGVTDAMFGDDTMESGVYIEQSGTAVNAGGNMLIMDGDSCYVDGASTTVDITYCEGTQLLVVSTGGEARILEITDVDTTNNETNLKQLWPKTATTKTWEDKDWGDAIDLGFSSITLSYAATNVTGNGTGDPQIIATILNKFDNSANANSDDKADGLALFQTEKLGEVLVDYDNTDATFKLYQSDAGTVIGNWSVKPGQGSSNDSLEISLANPTDVYELEEDSDYVVGIDTDEWGAIFKFDNENNDDLTIEYPEEQVIAKAYITPISASIVSGGAVAGTRVTSKRINIGYAKLASDLLAADPDMSKKNYLLIGGPCASDATAVAMGVAHAEPACMEGFVEGKSMIKLYDTGAGKFAMVVAGFSALDTQRATRVLANYKDYALSGDEVEVTGTSLTDISVKTVV